MARPIRAVIAEALARVVEGGRSLDGALEQVRSEIPLPADRAFAQDCIYGVLRRYFSLEWQLRTLLARPLRERESALRMLLLAGLQQVLYMALPAHAAVAETVSACDAVNKAWAKGLVNAVLRNALRRRPELMAIPPTEPEAHWDHPAWLTAALGAAWPDDCAQVLQANNQHPPLTLRVNRRRTSRAAYLAELATRGISAVATLHSPVGVRLTDPLPVTALPGFAEGLVSVQDEAAQFAACVLDVRAGQRTLDACAAPGGKTMHIQEFADGAAALFALDVDPGRLARLEENAVRLGGHCNRICGDAADPGSWWDGAPFQRILLDVPCSATGVIRRHPDIKLHRRQRDIAAFAASQAHLIASIWPLLERGGKLLYSTCSVLPQENDAVLAEFLAAHDDAGCRDIRADWGRPMRHGRQILTGEDDMDGFYYALIEKS